MDTHLNGQSKIKMVLCYERTYTSYDEVYNEDPVPGAPDFTTSLLSNSSNLTSNISFRMQRNLTGYSIMCTDVHGNKKECKLLGKMAMYLALLCWGGFHIY